jgi:hypothetical protein
MAEVERCGADSQCLGWREDPPLEFGITSIKPDTHMNLAALKHDRLLRTESLTQFYADIGKALGISRQKPGQHALDRVRWRGNLQHPCVPASKDLCVLADDVDVGEHSPAIRKDLLALRRQDETSPHVIK